MPQTRLGEEDRLFTVGYEGRTIDAFLDHVSSEGIQQLVDVRANPWSRKPGFTKAPLQDNLEAAGIAYEHIEPLGAPDELRHANLSTEAFADAYQAHLNEQAQALDQLARLARKTATAICCMEKNPANCHRRFIAQRLAADGWTIIHL